MPTYLNESEATYIVESAGNGFQKGPTISVTPGETVETDKFYNLTDFTKTLDTPLKSRIVANTLITLTVSEEDHILNEATRDWVFIDVVGELTVKPQLTSSTPILNTATDASPIIIFERENYPCEKLIVSGSGTCTIIEFAW